MAEAVVLSVGEAEARFREGGVEFELLGADKLLHYWPFIEHEMGLVPHTLDRFGTEDILIGAMEGRLQVWAVGPPDLILLVFVSQVSVYPKGNTLQVIWAGGRGLRAALEQVVEMFDKVAASQGCTDFDVVGREGWVKLLTPLGFTRRSVVLTRKVRGRLDS